MSSTLPHPCSSCSARWSGFNTSHCTTCHETFVSIKGFDRHRSGSHEHDTRHCTDPSKLKHGPRSKDHGKLIFRDAGRSYPCWAFNSDDTRTFE